MYAIPFAASGVAALRLISAGSISSTRWFSHQRLPKGSRILQTFSPKYIVVMSVTEVAPSSKDAR